MAWFKKNADPISARSRELNAEIAALEARIKKLDTQLQHGKSQPRLRTTAVPHGETITHTARSQETIEAPSPVPSEPVFEDVGRAHLKEPTEPATTREHYNELGVRKYDITTLWRRIRDLFRGPTTTNPRLVTYLAAGGVQGLRPLRYEKRVARNRFIAFAVGLFLLLLGIYIVFLKRG